MDAVDGVGGDIHRALEAEGHIGSPQIVVNGLGKADHVEALLAEQIGGLLAAVSPSTTGTPAELLVGVLHGPPPYPGPFSSWTRISLKGCLEVPRIVPPRVRIPEKSSAA